jgi:hypothetical protein
MAARIGYLATGGDEVRTLALYAAYSALAWRGTAPARIHVFTDRVEAFAPLAGAATLEPLPPERLREWRGPFDFVFRLKPKLLEHLLEQHPGDDAVLVDADTFFTGEVEQLLGRIGPGRAAMHEREYQPTEKQSLQLDNFRRRMRRARFRGEPITIDAWMWNSGVVGLAPSHLPLVRDWIEFVDAVYPWNPKPFVEQYGLSWLLQRGGDHISPTDDLVFHYYSDKARHLAAIRTELVSLAALPLDEALARVRMSPLRVEGRRPPKPRMPVHVRVSRSIRTRAAIVAGLLRGVR